MNTSIKTLLAAGVMTAFAMPALAETHMDLNSMTCEQYNELGGAERDRVAYMAVSSLDTNAMPSDGTATATENSIGTQAGESSGTGGSLEGSATATSIAPADNDLSRYAEEIRVMNRVCSRNWDAMVLEAAAGQNGTR